MRRTRETWDRRDFLKSGLTAAAGAVALRAGGARAAAPADKKIASPGAIPTRPFGKTGHTLPVLGHGGSAMIKQFITLYGAELTSVEERVAMVRHGYDSGMRYFDTARVYGESESIMGQALKEVRDEVYLATKIAVYSKDAVRRSVEKSLTELGTSYVDAMQIHSPTIERLGADGTMPIREELEKLRGEGMIRFIGLTTHVAFEDVHKLIGMGNFDQVLLAYGYFRRGMTSILSLANTEWREMCLAKAHELGMAIVAMKVMGANIFSHNAKALVPDFDEAARGALPGAAIRWVFSDERVSMLNVGCSYKSDIDANIATMKGDLRLTSADRKVLAEFSRAAYQSETVKKMETT